MPEILMVLTFALTLGASATPLADGDAEFDRQVRNARAAHWAFKAVEKGGVPEGPAPNPIDRFVDWELDRRGIVANDLADARTLIRRASLDLTGLPPTFEEVEDFVADRDPEAYDHLVYRLLRSEHYGERWGRYWLDVARYADTKGYVFVEDRNFPFSHTYRDYVIRAFNRDLPYDRFLLEQLAADRLELGRDKRALAAMGFLTLGRRFLGNVHDIIDDRIDVVTRGLMGLTVSCARCHDHKSDPISMADYYGLYGIFRSSKEPVELPLLAAPDKKDPVYGNYLAAVEEKRATKNAYLAEQHASLRERAREQAIPSILAACQVSKDTQGEDPSDEAFQGVAHQRSLDWQMVKRWFAFLKERPNDPIFAPWSVASTDGVLSLEAAREAVGAFLHPAVESEWFRDPPQDLRDLSALYLRLLSRADELGNAFSRDLFDGSPPDIPLEDVHSLSSVPVRQKIMNLENAVTNVEATHPGRPDRAMILEERQKLYDPVIFRRGQSDRPGERVPRRFLTVLSEEVAPFTQGSGRLELARAIASRDNPLTARVWVNRVWKHHFGRGLVSTPDDFGLDVDPPDHLGLLNYLTAWFIERSWSTKELHRLIMTSETYRRSSQSRDPASSLDPENQFWWRTERRRLDFEALRDSVLAVAGTLNRKMYGPSVSITSAKAPTRRTVYSRIERQNLPEVFRTFDFANPDTTCSRRHTTTVPQQALFMMNSGFMIEQSRALSRRVAEEEDPNGRVQALFRLAVQRDPTDAERRRAIAFLEEQSSLAPESNDRDTVWHYGYGRLHRSDPSVDFTPLPHFQDDMWKGGSALPDPTVGWVFWNSNGGHPGGDEHHMAIRRFRVPLDGLINVRGALAHRQTGGDGVRGTIAVNGSSLEWNGDVHNGRIRSDFKNVVVQKGDTLDFIVACGENEHFDSFEWLVRVTLVTSTGSRVWTSKDDFRGPAASPDRLDPSGRLAQVLLLSNEFAFVD